MFLYKFDVVAKQAYKIRARFENSELNKEGQPVNW